VPAGGYYIFGIPDDTFYKTEYTLESYLGTTSLTTQTTYYAANTN